MKISAFCLSFLLTFFFSMVQAAESGEQDCLKPLIALAEEGDSSISEYSQEKICLNPGRLLFSLDGIFIQTDSDGLCPINRLSFDTASGYFQPVMVKCNKCGCAFEKGPLYCPNCGERTY